MYKVYRIKLEEYVVNQWEDRIVDTVEIDDSKDIASGRIPAFEKKIRDYIRSLND